MQTYKNQGVTGVRFMFAFRGGADSTALLPSGNDYVVNSTWKENVRKFFQDINAKGINDITISPSFFNTPNDGEQTLSRNDPCFGGSPTFKFWPTAPFPVESNGHPWKGGHNDSYNCAPDNPIFVGWQNIYDVFDAMLGIAAEPGIQLNVYEFDVQQETNPFWFTVYGRLFYDNKHGATGNPDVLNSIRFYMSLHGFDPYRVTWSTTSERSSPNGASVYDCGSVYGDSARIIGLSEVVAALGGGLIGQPSGWSKNFELACGGTPGSMISLPISWTQPKIVDVHAYPCIQGSVSCDLSPTQAALVDEAAQADFTGIRNLLDSFGPSGWRPLNWNIYNSIFMLGETHSNAPTTGTSCEGAPQLAPEDTVQGFNASTLGGSTTAVFRPWNSPFDSCYPLSHTINPPYDPQP